MQGAGCRVQGAGCRVQGAGCRVQGAGCRACPAPSRERRGETHVRAHISLEWTWLCKVTPVILHGIASPDASCTLRSPAPPLTPCTLHPHSPYTLHPGPFTLHPAQYILHPAPYTLHPAPCTLHPATFTLHPTPYTLHPTPYTLHPTPKTLSTFPWFCPQTMWAGQFVVLGLFSALRLTDVYRTPSMSN